MTGQKERKVRKPHAQPVPGALLAGFVCLLPVMPAMAAAPQNAGSEAASAGHGGGLPEIMAADHKGVTARSAVVGPWRYGCAYPSRGSTQATQFCTIQLEQMTGTSMEGGFFLLTHATSDMSTMPLAAQPWEVSVNLPTNQPFGPQASPRLVIDQGVGVPLSVQSCDSTGCMAHVTLSPAAQQAFITGHRGTLEAETTTGQHWSYGFSLADVQQGMGQIASWTQHGELLP